MTDILTELTALLSSILPVETAIFSGKTPPEYAVLTPLIDTDTLFGDNCPGVEVQEVRISIYTKHNYISLKNGITKMLYNNDFVITEKRYIEREDDTGYFHYCIDAAKQYILEEE